MLATTTTISATEFISLVQGIASLNLGYLGLCVTIIIFAGGLTGGFYYLFNFKPLQESIKKQREEFESIKKEIESRIEQINTNFVGVISTQTTELRASIDQTVKEIDQIKRDAFEKIEKAEKQFLDFNADAKKELVALKKAHQLSDLKRIWEEHYMWEGREVYENSIEFLLQYREKSLEYNIPIISDELWLERVESILVKIKNYKHTDKRLIQSRLVMLIDKIIGQDDNKEKVKKEIDKVFV